MAVVSDSDVPVTHVLVLAPGYAEEAANSSMILWYPGGFANVEVALLTVATTLKETVEEGLDREDRNAYRSPVCPHCGKSTYQRQPLEREWLADVFRECAGGTTDSASGFIQELMGYGFDFRAAEIPPAHWARATFVNAFAGEILADLALGRTKPDGEGHFDDYAHDWPQHITKPDDLPWDMPANEE